MSIATDPVPKVVFPTHLDLPWTDDKPVDNIYQPLQAALLTGCLTPRFDQIYPEKDYFIGSNNGIYWRTTNPPENGCKAPDWFFVPGVPRLLDGRLRLSYVMWVETVAPAVVMEFVSGTGAEEHDATPFTGKYWVYARGIHAEVYVIWDRLRERLEVFELHGHRYQSVKPDADGRCLIASLDLKIGSWDGPYQGNPGPWLRVWDAEGNLIPTAEERAEESEAAAEAERSRTRAERRRTREEKQRADQAQELAQQETKRADREKQRAEQEKQRAEQEKQRAEQEKQRAEQEKQRAEQLMARLRALGVDPNLPS